MDRTQGGQTGRSEVRALRRHIEKIWALGRRVGGRGAVRLAALVASLALGAATLPALGSAASSGQLYAFGDNESGELGNPTNSDLEKVVPNPTPTLVTLPGEAGPVTQAATGGDFSLTVTSTGQLYAFGSNYFGQLGNPTNNHMLFEANPTPTLVTLPGASGPVTETAAGAKHSLGLTSSGQLYAFGENWFGQLGNPTNNQTEEPNPTPTLVTLPGASGPVAQIAAGAYHSLALTSTGQLYAFGDNYWGQLGAATNDKSPDYTSANPTPTLVTLPGASGPVTEIAAGAWFSLAVTSTGQLYAFGSNYFGQLGDRTNNLTEEPNPTPTLVTLPGASGPVTQIAAGYAHSLALTSSGQLYAFGENSSGQLGNTTNDSPWSEAANPTPTLVTLPGASGRVMRIAAGGGYSLALTSSGQLYAFGSNTRGQLGNTTNNDRAAGVPTPALVELPGGANIDTMATGPVAAHTLVVAADLAVANSSLPAGEIDVPYGAQAQGMGGFTPYRWAASGLPQGLSIDHASGAISGTPTAVGSYTPIITLTDGYGIEASMPLTITIKGPNETLPPSTPNETPPPSVPNEMPPPSVPQEALPPSVPSEAASPPIVQNARQSATRWREGRQLAHISRGQTPIGTIFSFSLNERATVSFSFTQLLGGRRGDHSCLGRVHENVQRKSCSHTVPRGTLSFTGHSGANNLIFAGRISRTNKLRPGRYELTITATNSAGQRSVPVSLSFTTMS
jgi:alpha-tubulin suppressor-like RCC1 family protein